MLLTSKQTTGAYQVPSNTALCLTPHFDCKTPGIEAQPGCPQILRSSAIMLQLHHRTHLHASLSAKPQTKLFKRTLRVQCSTVTTSTNLASKWTELEESVRAYQKAPPSMKLEFSSDVLAAMNDLREAGAVPKWGCEAPEAAAAAAAGSNAQLDPAGPSARRNVFMGELKQMGIKNPDLIAIPSTRNDAAFLFTVVGVCSVAAVLLGQLPGDWGFFTSYLTGGIVLGVLAVGSTAPGLLQVFIDKFSQLWPDYKERVVAHEAAHLLLGYLMGVPVTSYSLGIGQEHVEFAEAKIQARIITRDLTDAEIDALAVVSVAGIAAEGIRYEEVLGQTADLSDLQRILLRSKTKLTANQQQNITRWAVWRAAMLLKKYKTEHETVQAKLAQGVSVDKVVQAIEAVPSAAA